MPNEPLPAVRAGYDEGRHEAEPSRPTLKANIAGLDLVFTLHSPSLVTVTIAEAEKWVANVARLPSGTRVISHNFHYRDQFGRDALDPRGRGEREAVCDHAAELWAR